SAVRAAAGKKAVLFSVTHGAGAPAAGWATDTDQRALQGALRLSAVEQLAARHVAAGPFLPGGLWLLFACFGAATPAESAYHQWLVDVAARGLLSEAKLKEVVASLPASGKP